MRRSIAVMSMTVAMAAVPSMAFAANVSSGDGSGSQSVTQWHPAGAELSGTLRSTNGNAVYYSGTRVYDNVLDENDGRYTSNTSSKSAVAKSGRVGSATAVPSPNYRVDGVKVKVCRDRGGLPDPCGSNSATMRR